MHQLPKFPYSYFLLALEFYLRVLFPLAWVAWATWVLGLMGGVGQILAWVTW